VAQVARRGEQGDGTPSREINDRVDRGNGLFSAELAPVALGELGEAFRSMAVELTQRGTRREVLSPLVEVCVVLAQTARPESVYEDANTIAALRRVIRAFDPNTRHPISVPLVSSGFFERASDEIVPLDNAVRIFDSPLDKLTRQTDPAR
jgi:hypothetical protein